MQIVVQGYKGLSLIVGLNWDRMFFFGTITVGLLAGAFLGSAITTPLTPIRAHKMLRAASFEKTTAAF